MLEIAEKHGTPYRKRTFARRVFGWWGISGTAKLCQLDVARSQARYTGI